MRNSLSLLRRAVHGTLTGGLAMVTWGCGLAVAGENGWERQGLMFKMEPGTLVQNFTSPAEPLEEGRWRLWCSLSG
ncbi:MAG: hypothetical protein ACAI34_18495, partial [Verrucomicrobium sp.]